jgi:hypothetical protein
MPLADRATNSLDLLDSYEIGDRPIIFITHSMGGLLVKQMLRSARDFGKWRAIAQKTRGIVFLSTPHSGSDMASWINHIGGIVQTTVSVEELEAHHSRLRELNLLYRNDEQFSQVPMLVYCEMRRTKGILVVNQTSADPGIKGVIPVPMDFDHISICKVADRKSQIYRQVKRLIQDNLTTPHDKTELAPFNNVPKLGIISLSPVFVKRNEEIKKITDILLCNQYQLIVLLSPPGYGKTTLAQMICNEDSIKEHFLGGIFWINISDGLDEKEELRELYQNLTGSIDSLEQESQLYNLSKAWKEKPNLVVLDDLQTPEALTAFLSISDHFCKLLITTQRRDIFNSFHNRKVIELNPLSTEELRTALRTILKGEKEEKIDLENDFIKRKLKQLADLFYQWPSLLGRFLEETQGLKHDGYSPETILEQLIEDIKELDFDDEANKAINKSFKYLTHEEQKCFHSLLIFSSDLNIPFSVIKNLWNLPIGKVKRLCDKLHRFSLLKKTSREQGVIQLNSHVRKCFLSDVKLKKELTYVNKDFVEYYASKYNLNSPDNLPDTIPLPERNFLKRVYKHHWRKVKN